MVRYPVGTSAWPVIFRQWHWQSRISIGKLQSRALTFKLRHADKGLKIVLQCLKGAFGVWYFVPLCSFGQWCVRSNCT